MHELLAIAQYSTMYGSVLSQICAPHTLLFRYAHSGLLLLKLSPGGQAVNTKGVPCCGPLIQVQLPSMRSSWPPIQAILFGQYWARKAFSEADVTVAR